MRESRYSTVRYGDLHVSYLPVLDGGGMGFGQSFVPIVREIFGRVGRVHEFCAGPGFIGFSLLAHGLCESLCLSDINPEAVEAARSTVRRNGLGDRVSVYLSDALDGIPPGERWDLVVSNPPHFRDQFQDSLRHHDAEWLCHRKFYSGVGAHLNPGASLLIQENYQGSSAEDFAGMIAAGGLQTIGSLMYRAPGVRGYFDSYYFLWVGPKAHTREPTPPSGASFGYVTTEPECVSVELSRDRVPEIELPAWTRHRLRISNRLARSATLHMYATKLLVIPRFLRTVWSVAADEIVTTFPFQLFPGRYEMREAGSKRTLLVIRAR